MLPYFHALKVTTKIGLLLGCAIAGIFTIAAVFLISERSLILEDRKAAVRQTVQIADTLIKHFHGRQQSGELTLEQAQAQAKTALSQLRYSGNEYFWINDMKSVFVMHPFLPKLVGVTPQEQKSPALVALLNAFVEVVKTQEAGFHVYKWPKPNHSEPVPKVSYVQGFAPWGWIVGSGVYTDDVHAIFMGRLFEFLAYVLIIAFVLLAAGFAIIRSLSRQLGSDPGYAAQVANEIAEGDLSVPIHVRPGDDSSLIFAIRNMRDNLARIVSQVRACTESISGASTQISSGSRDLSARVEQQASSLTQTASAMQQITATVLSTTDNAQQANELASSAAQTANKAKQITDDLVHTMGSINSSSRKVAEILSIIDGIAFQTNILALNAAVEAARAGEQGRGFAVVAGEVRSLAQKSSLAAKEIKMLIDDSADQVAGGTSLVNNAGAIMGDIVSSVHKVSAVIDEISTASREQSTGIGEINTAVGQMDSTTQQNAALVNESADAAESLRILATDLGAIVGSFKLNAAQVALAIEGDRSTA